MKKTAAWLAVRALEQIGVRYTFGIPGVHNTELYDELNSSEQITPVLVTHEGGGAFMADAVSRCGGGIGTLVIVPAAGFTHAASGIGEALLDGIPLLILSGGIRQDMGKRYQLHELDQLELVKPLTKAAFRITRHEDVVSIIHEAYRIATSGEPGPVFVELPVDLQLFPGTVPELPVFVSALPAPVPSAEAITRAAAILREAKRPGLFVGWGARGAQAELAELAEFLQAPVSTTLQGLATFPSDHPLHVGFSFGPAAVPAARNAFAKCDALLAVGTRFGEIATGSFGVTVPEQLVHADINPQVFNANYPAKVTLEGDARVVVTALLAELKKAPAKSADTALTNAIASDKAAYRASWLAHDSKGRVNPGRFFDELRAQVSDDAITVVDDGNHTYLTAELFPVRKGGHAIMPTDFNAMGYAVPAAIGAKLAQPQREVFGIVGDGAFMMTCMESITAVAQGLGIAYYIFSDGELSQIAQAQQIPYNRKPCTTIGKLNVAGVAMATGAAHIQIANDAQLADGIAEARRIAASGQPVLVDVQIDYSKATAFTQGAVKTNFGRFPLSQQVRMVGRALVRKITG
jgi:acetolactate synthase-1/2/3 large subunit